MVLKDMRNKDSILNNHAKHSFVFLFFSSDGYYTAQNQTDA